MRGHGLEPQKQLSFFEFSTKQRGLARDLLSNYSHSRASPLSEILNPFANGFSSSC